MHLRGKGVGFFIVFTLRVVDVKFIVEANIDTCQQEGT